MARNICIDGLFLRPQYLRCGTSRYLVNLLRAMGVILAASGGINLRVLVASKAGARSCGLDFDNGLQLRAVPLMRLAKVWRLGLFMNIVNTMTSDAVFLPSPVPIHLKTSRIAATIHDIIPLLRPDQFESLSGIVLRHSLSSTLRKADLIFTDSEYSKNDMVGHCGTPTGRIVVAPLGFDSALFNSTPADANEAAGVLARYGVACPYVLHVGAIEPRKNLVRLVRAYQLLANRQRSLQFQLVLCGRLAFGYQDLVELVGTPELNGRVVLTGPVPDSELPILYKGALACVMPSLYEGFGLPPLEAMACGTPVISSNRSCLPEIGGDAPIYFAPESVEEMAEAIGRVVDDSTLRAQMVERGLKRAQLFSWEDCARKTFAALRQL